jgi:ceramide glucosyltransferase
VTWLRPLKAGVPGLAGKLEEFVAALRPDDEVIFGVEAGAVEAKLCEGLAVRFAAVKVIVCGAEIVDDRKDTQQGSLKAGLQRANPKIAKLLQMTRHARHEHWILADAEARIEAGFAEAFRQEWVASKADALTAGYRFVGVRTWVQQLDALAAVQTLWPGLVLAQVAGPLQFTLGACTGLRRGDVEAIGGWAVLGVELAEDQRLGALLAANGRTVRLSEVVLDLEADPLTWRDYWRHQRRVAITYRVATPAGAAGMVLTRGFTLCLLLAVVFPSRLTWTNAALAAALHVLAVMTQAAWLRCKCGPWVFLALIADSVEAACWALAWGSRRVWWGGKWQAITWRGQFRTAGDKAES